MKAEKRDRYRAGDCNFCDRPFPMPLTRVSQALDDDEFVIEITASGPRSGGMKARLCFECVREFSAFLSLEKL